MRAARFLFRRWVERPFALIVGCSIVATACFVSATQNWLVTRNRWYETLALLLICITLFRPGYWLVSVWHIASVDRPLLQSTLGCNNTVGDR